MGGAPEGRSRLHRLADQRPVGSYCCTLCLIRQGRKVIELQEGNVFIRDCLSSGRRFHVTLTSGGSKGGARDPRPPGGLHSFNFMQFLGKFGKIVCWRPPPPGSCAPSSGKSWIRHCLLMMHWTSLYRASRHRTSGPPSPRHDIAGPQATPC